MPMWATSAGVARRLNDPNRAFAPRGSTDRASAYGSVCVVTAVLGGLGRWYRVTRDGSKALSPPPYARAPTETAMIAAVQAAEPLVSGHCQVDVGAGC